MKKTMKLFAMMMCMALFALTLTACDGDDNADTTDGGNDNANVSGEVVTLEFFNMKTEIVHILEELIEEYESLNPNIRIDLVTPPDGFTVLNTRMAASDVPDIFTNWPNAMFFMQVDAGHVLDISGTGIMDNIHTEARDLWRHNGGEYVAPISYNVSGVWYNVDIFESAGITELPQTWEELIQVAEILEAAGYTPFVTPGVDPSIGVRQLQVFMASSMPNTYDAFQESVTNGSVSLDGPYMAELRVMAERMIQMAEFSQSDILGMDQDNATADFANGNGAMIIGGSWLLASITAANPNINVSMMPIPGTTFADTNTCAYPGDFSLAIAAETPFQQEAIDFVRWMTSPEIANRYAELEGNPSVIYGVDFVAPEFAQLYEDFVTTGKFILNPDVFWTNAQSNSAGSAVHTLFFTSDIDLFLELLAEAFNDN